MAKYRYHRNPKTTQEKRKYYDAEDQDVHVRGRRRPRQLRDSYDDIVIPMPKWGKK